MVRLYEPQRLYGKCRVGKDDAHDAHRLMSLCIECALSVFKDSPAAHDVVEVAKDGYLPCTESKNISGTLRTGQDTVDLDSLWTSYFICSVQGHCATGMKAAAQGRAAWLRQPVAGGDERGRQVKTAHQVACA
ncbi:hypothetical protein ACQ4PT_036304 [Festuca glaucescens]